MKNMGVGGRLLVGFGIVLGLLVVTMGVYQVTVGNVNSGYQELVDYQLSVEQHATQAQASMLQLRREEKDFLLRSEASYVEAHKKEREVFDANSAELGKLAKTFNDEELAKDVTNLDAAMVTYYAAIDKLAELKGAAGLNSEEGALFEFEQAGRDLQSAIPKARIDLIAEVLEVRRQEKNWRLRLDQESLDKTNAAVATLAQHLKESGMVDADAALTKYKTSFDIFVTNTNAANAAVEEARTAVHEIEPILAEIETESADNAAKAQKSVKNQSSSSELIALIVGLAAIILGVLAAIVLRNQITGPLNRVIAGLSAGSEQVSSAADQVAQASQQMAQGASEQASSLEETSSSLEELSSMTRQNAENSKQADGMAREAKMSAAKGVDAMDKMQSAIGRIKESADATAKIIKTIDDIAFQTNLLALNAAVEAARAGEAGKGFAVVAEEVRNLAQRSAEAAKSTAALIEGSQANADDGVKVTGEVGDLLKQIAEQAEKVTSLVSEVAAASDEQAQGIDQINTAVSEMDRVTQSSSSNSEESASASEELSAQARELQDMVIQLRVVVGGTKSAAKLDEYGRSAASSVAGPVSVDHRLSQSVHQMLGAHESTQGGNGNGNGRKPVGVGAPRFRPEEVLPLNDDEMKDF